MYHPGQILNRWQGNEELRKITFTPKKRCIDVMSWLPKQALWKVQIVSPNEVDKHFHKVTKHNKQHQFGLF